MSKYRKFVAGDVVRIPTCSWPNQLWLVDSVEDTFNLLWAVPSRASNPFTTEPGNPWSIVAEPSRAVLVFRRRWGQ